MTIVTWLIRFNHVLGGALWVGGYALLALVLIPLWERHQHEQLHRLAMTVVRLLTYVGMWTMGFGILLVWRTRGFATLLGGGEWGAIIIAAFLTAIALLGLGDGALRTALERGNLGGNKGRARRWALIGFALTMVAIAMMTRALYAVS